MLWDISINCSSTLDAPCMLAGDFNELLSQYNEWDVRLINRTRSNLFWSFINKCSLIDLGYKGGKYTWSNHRHKNNGIYLILERLDHIFSNDMWLQLYPKSRITYLPKSHFVHTLLLITITNKI